MVTILVEFTFKPEHAVEGKKLLDELARASLIEEVGCLQYFVNVDASDENVVILYESFRDVEAQNIHRLTKHYKDILVDAIPYLIENKKVRYLK